MSTQPDTPAPQWAVELNAALKPHLIGPDGLWTEEARDAYWIAIIARHAPQPTAPTAQPEQPAATGTPRTDKAEFFIATTPKQSPDEGGMFVTSNFARQLERELAEARAGISSEYGRQMMQALQSHSSAIGDNVAAAKALIAQLAEARAERDEACKVITDLRLGPSGGKPISAMLKTGLSEMSERAYEQASHKGNLER
jgi:hypothetical protein